jgi:outer membrane lipoprotein SlyB
LIILEALAAVHGPVRRLSIYVGEGCAFVDNVAGDVLSYRASRGVQDVRIGADASSRMAHYNDDSSWFF